MTNISIEKKTLATATLISGVAGLNSANNCKPSVCRNTNSQTLNMKRPKTLLLACLLALLCLASTGLVRAEQVYIGNGGTTTNTSIPTNSYFKFNLTQQIYTAEEIGTAGIITSISFYNGGVEKTRSLDFYLIATDKTSFENNTDFVPVTVGAKVFGGTVTMVANDWTTIIFDKVFEYDNTSNLLLVIDDNTGSYESGSGNQMACRTFPTTSNQAVRIYSDYVDFNPLEPPTSIPSNCYAATYSNKNQIKLNIERNAIFIGNGGTNTHICLPSYSFYNYALTQQIYTAAEIGPAAGIITSIGFFNGGNEETRNYDFYMIASNKTSFTSNTDWQAVTEGTKVFSGSVTMTANDWTRIVLDKPFVYDGKSNIILVTDDNTGTYTTSPHMACRVFDATSQALYIYDDNTNFDPMTPSNHTGTMNNEKNQIVFQIDNHVAVIGSGGTDFDTALPTHSRWNYSLTQQIYPAHELGTAGIIRSISFMNTESEGTRNYDFYMVATDKTGFLDGADWVAVTEADKVFSGEVTMLVNAWTNIVFDKPFIHDGESNLVLVAADNTGYENYISCRTYNAPGKSLLIFSDVTNLDVFNPPTVSGEGIHVVPYSKKNQIIIQIERFGGSLNYICNGATSTHWGIPTNSDMDYSFSQQIYTAEEIGAAGTISSIGFFNTNDEKTRTINFYMKSTNKTAFDDETDWVAVTDDDKVFSGEVTFLSNNWTMIEFDTPFDYDGTSNLVFVTDDNTGATMDFLLCLTYVAQNQTIYTYGQSDIDPINPINGIGNYVMNRKNQIILHFTPPEPPMRVVAEYSPSINDPNSTQVKLEWDYGIGDIEDFETGDFSTYDWLHHDPYSWVISGTNPQHGNYCMKSGNDGAHSSSSSIEFTTRILYDGMISFFTKISCEYYHDKGYFYIDGHQAGYFTDQTDGSNAEWQENIYNITAGYHTFKWTYMKDISVNTGDDCLYVDNIRFFTHHPELPMMPTTSYYNVYRAKSDGSGMQRIATDLATDEYLDTTWVDLPRGDYKYGVRHLSQYGMLHLPAFHSSHWNLLASFDGPVASSHQNSTATDGKHIYTFSNGSFYKYDLNGNLIEDFNISGCNNIKSLTHDGQYFYGYQGRYFYCLDLANRTMISRVFSDWNIDCCTYDAGQDEFWVCSTNGTLLRINRSCQITNSGLNLSDLGGFSYYRDTHGIPHLLLVKNEGNAALLYDYNLANHSLNNTPLINITATPGLEEYNVCKSTFIGEYQDKLALYCNMYKSLGQSRTCIFELADMPKVAWSNTLAKTYGDAVQTITLSQGWNWISTYVEADNLLEQLKNGIGSYGIEIWSNSNSTEYDEEWGWFGDLDDIGITNGETYLVKTSTTCSVQLQGLPANPANYAITINHGWNWIGFPCSQEITIQEALSNFEAETGDQIWNSENSTEYDDGWGWFGDIESLVPGEGYMYYSNSTQPKTLIFQTGSKKQVD